MRTGFTLIELMIVVTIIGILASIAVPAYRVYTIRARVSECAVLFSPVKTEISLQYSENGVFPVDQDAFEENGRIFMGDPEDDTDEGISGDYVESMSYHQADGVAEVECQLADDSRLGDPVDEGGARGGVLKFNGRAKTQSIAWTVSTTDDSSLPVKFWPVQG